MFKNVRIILLLLITLIALAALVSCNGTGDGEVTTTASGNTDAEPESFEIAVVDGRANVSVIRPDGLDADSAQVKAAQSVYITINQLLDAYPTLGTDFLKGGDSHDPESAEILVGLTNYDETAEVIASLSSYGDYAVKAVGRKLVVLAYSDDGYSRAMHHLASLLSTSYDAERGVISLDLAALNKTDVANPQLAALPLFDGGSFLSYYDAGLRLGADSRCDEIIISDVTPALYSAYLEKLASGGFSQYASHEMGKNSFATYTNDKYTVNVGYYDYEKSARLLIEPLSPSAPRAEDNMYTKVTTSQLTLLGLQQPYNDGLLNNGLSAFIRLEDGRFIVIDGGINNAATTTDLIQAIKEQSADYTSRPVIAAWIITHSHSDHAGVLSTRYSELAASLKIESIMTNFVSNAEAQRAQNTSSSVWGATEGSQSTGIIKACRELGAVMYKVHVGQVFHFADAKLEILYTLESYAPKVANNYNTTSTVIKMTFGGKTTFFNPGDATGNALNICAKMYGGYLQSDILMATHHGYITQATGDSGVKAAYRHVNPSLVLWAHGVNNHASVIQSDWNSVLFSLSNYKEGYIAGTLGDRTIIPLPYTAGQVQGPNKELYHGF